MSSRRTIAIIGAGSRGQIFAQMFSRSHKAQVTAVAEPRKARRQLLVDKYAIAPTHTFETWEEFIDQPRLTDAVFLGTLDRDHVVPAVACMKLGYDILLEKPMAVTLEDCQLIERTQRETGRILGVCHSLRYQKGFHKVKELVGAGAIGRVITLDLVEPVCWWHQAHSFVRGNWGNSSRATFMLLAKSCHDIDYIHYLLGRRCLKVSSFGALTYFRPDNAPADSGTYCVACPIEHTCSYSAIRHYVNANREQWPADVVSDDHGREAHLAAITTGPYGRCVWRCDNDVVDHQTVNMLFEDQITATFTMTAFHQGGRRLRVGGTLGELEFADSSITIRTFADSNTQTTHLGEEEGGHGGGDDRIVAEFIDALHTRDDSGILATAQESLKSHTVVFAAERSRLEGRTVCLDEMAPLEAGVAFGRTHLDE